MFSIPLQSAEIVLFGLASIQVSGSGAASSSGGTAKDSRVVSPNKSKKKPVKPYKASDNSSIVSAESVSFMISWFPCCLLSFDIVFPQKWFLQAQLILVFALGRS